MAEITRVPLQPVAKGSLTKIWLGVIIAVLLGAGLAFAAVPKGFSVDTLVAGEGDYAQEGDMVFLKYKGSFADTGEVFDESQDIPLPIEGVFPEGSPWPVEPGNAIEGFYLALQQVQVGGTYEVYIPSDLAYGASPPPGSPIPPNADLVFEIEVTGILTREEFDRNLMILQRAMQGGLGAPGGPAGAPAEAIPGQ